MNVLIPEFAKENPGIKVNAVSHEWADLHDTILINAKADTLPAVARLDSAWIPEFQKLGILLPLDEEMADFDAVSGGLLDSAMSTAVSYTHLDVYKRQVLCCAPSVWMCMQWMRMGLFIIRKCRNS